jgi:hypothetical protein
MDTPLPERHFTGHPVQLAVNSPKPPTRTAVENREWTEKCLPSLRFLFVDTSNNALQDYRAVRT